jgi:hypothetical protein
VDHQMRNAVRAHDGQRRVEPARHQRDALGVNRRRVAAG